MDTTMMWVIGIELDHNRMPFWKAFCCISSSVELSISSSIHLAGIIHGDLKPSNIVVKENYTLNGLAQAAESHCVHNDPYVVHR